MKKYTKILIVGGTGFIGYHLAEFRLKKKWSVISFSKNNPRKIRKLKRVKYVKGDLYKKSGHLELYKDAMYPAMDVDGIDYYVKPMNCPHHHKIYAASPKSYRDLPYRISEYGTCYRYEGQVNYLDL